MKRFCQDCKKEIPEEDDEVLCDWCEKMVCLSCADPLEYKHADGICAESEGE